MSLSDRLREHMALADAADSHGKWQFVHARSQDYDGYTSVMCSRRHPIIEGHALIKNDNFAHIAANDPATVKALCAVALAAEARFNEWNRDTFLAMKQSLDALEEAMSK